MDNVAKRAGRRTFLLSGLGLAGVCKCTAAETEQVYRFVNDRCDIQVSVDFHDRYSSRGFWFYDSPSNGPFCLSFQGEKDRHCLENFVGSLAIVRYEVRSHSKQRHVATLREYVRDIDRDERLEPRPSVDRKVDLHNGVASDIQAFGYRADEPSQIAAAVRGSASLWYYFRQDLYLESDRTPFLIIHWKHALNAIRMLDIIPAAGTSLVSR